MVSAKPEEYAGLLRELRGIYGRSRGADDPAIELKVCSRMTAKHREEFRASYEAARQSLRDDPSGGPWIPNHV